MATLKKYVGRGDYYVHDAFNNKGHLFNITYQITPPGLKTLLDRHIPNGGQIPESLFLRLKKAGDLYTGHSGVQGSDDQIKNSGSG